MTERSDGPVAYTDGGCIGNPGPGGWGVHVEFPDGRVIDLGGSELHTTNNRMELRAAIEAARAVKDWPSATIVADSQYVLKGITSWIAGWKRKGWVTSTGQPVVNQDLWEELDAVSTPRLTWEWTKGHAGDPGNERCDEIAAWFSSSVAPLVRPRRASVAREPSSESNGVSASSRAAVPSRPAASTAVSLRPGAGGQIYLSLVDGVLARHRTWGECDSRVRGVRSAKYKKVKNAAEERETLAKWGVTEADLFGVPSADFGV